LVLDITHLVVVIGVFLFLLLIRRGLRMVRLKAGHRARLDRILPVAEMVVGLVFLLWAFSLFADEESGLTWWMAGAVALGLLVAGWFAIRDVVSGIVLRSENSFKPGQWIQTEQAEGFVMNLGYRTMEIETETGLQIKLPYSQLTRRVLATADRTKTAYAHTFFLELPDTSSVAELTSLMRVAALTAFWSSPQRDPYIHYVEQKEGAHRFEVTVFSMNEAYTTDLERSVRRQVKRALQEVSGKVAHPTE
jgi:small-conductance mechanosensitive channel